MGYEISIELIIFNGSARAIKSNDEKNPKRNRVVKVILSVIRVNWVQVWVVSAPQKQCPLETEVIFVPCNQNYGSANSRNEKIHFHSDSHEDRILCSVHSLW